MIRKICRYIKDLINKNRFVEEQKKESRLRNRIKIQVFASISFLILSIVNIIQESYIMLIFTLSGFVINMLFAYIAKVKKISSLSAISSICTCSILFGFFVVYGGNGGFSSLWIVLIPLLAMSVMNFWYGLVTGIIIQGYLIVVFWTPIKNNIYAYDEEFCLRFPLFYFVAFILGLVFAIQLIKSEYNECKRLLKLEELTLNAQNLARTDPLTKLSNRRYAYEKFESDYLDDSKQHCIVIGDIDNFKLLNDTYGHEFGDQVLVIVSKYFLDVLPTDYLKSRWGGEEFLFAANSPITEVYKEIDNLRQMIADHVFTYNDDLINITITFGIAEYCHKDDINKAITIADDRLYKGKKRGKNSTNIND